MRARENEPAGARAEPSAAPAGDQDSDGRARWKAALTAHQATRRRRTGRRRTGGYRAGMARRPPPPPDGDQAA